MHVKINSIMVVKAHDLSRINKLKAQGVMPVFVYGFMLAIYFCMQAIYSYLRIECNAICRDVLFDAKLFDIATFSATATNRNFSPPCSHRTLHAQIDEL